MLSATNALAVLVLLSSTSAAPALQASGGDSEATSSKQMVVDWINQKSPAVHAFTSPSPAEYQTAIDEDRDMLRARILLDSSTTVEFHEHPKDIGFYDSTVVISRRGEPSRSFNKI